MGIQLAVGVFATEHHREHLDDHQFVMILGLTDPIVPIVSILRR
jgi:hypothetical protein